MSEETSTNVQATDPANAGGEQVETKDQAAEVNARLLEESKRNKKQAQEYKAKLEEMEKSKLKEKEEYKSLWEKSEEKLQGLYKTLVKEKVRAAVGEKASKAGAVDLDAVMLLGNRELLQVDEETLEVHGSDSYVEDLKKNKAYLFQTAKSSNINGVTPGGVVKGTTKQLKELTIEEIKSQLRSLG